ncbi:hypothetical protein ACFQI7_16555 [Paenibacillus allorhizosphaerae]|uniref:hypothetical protein n=1 Tax=Paenibacillus allorhizosphaerae TaxID=2849866 RepID=UPI001C4073C3|nr:hypothetical protein [Paenibacillus allorhizosphaerae]
MLETEFICYYFWPEEEGEEEASVNPSRKQGEPGVRGYSETQGHSGKPDGSGEQDLPGK